MAQTRLALLAVARNKTQHLALATTITCSARFSTVKILSLRSIKIHISTRKQSEPAHLRQGRVVR